MVVHHADDFECETQRITTESWQELGWINRRPPYLKVPHVISSAPASPGHRSRLFLGSLCFCRFGRIPTTPSENDAGVRIQRSVADPSTVVARCQSGRASSTAVEFCEGTAQIANMERGPAARLSHPAMRVARGIQRLSHMPSSLHWPGRGVELRSGVRGRA